MSVHRQGELTVEGIIPDRIGDGILDHASLHIEPRRKEGLSVGELQFRPEVMVEIRIQVRITQRQEERVGIVKDRVQLRGRGLSATAEIEQADVGVVIEIIEQHRSRGEIPDGTGIINDILPGTVGLVIGLGRNGRCTELRPQGLVLVHERNTHILVQVPVKDVVAIYGIQHLSRRRIRQYTVAKRKGGRSPAESAAVIGKLFRLGTGIMDIVTSFHIEIVAQGLGIDNP